MFSLVRFEIPMHNTIVVKVLQGKDCFSKVHSCHFYRQWAHVLEQVGTISTLMKQKNRKPWALRLFSFLLSGQFILIISHF